MTSSNRAHENPTVDSIRNAMVERSRSLEDLGVRAVIVGGSIARDEFVKGWSDVDLLVVCESAHNATGQLGQLLASSIPNEEASTSIATVDECEHGEPGRVGLTNKEIRMLSRLGTEAVLVWGSPPKVGEWVVQGDAQSAPAALALQRRDLRRLAVQQTLTQQLIVKAIRHLFTVARLSLRLGGTDVIGYDEVASAIGRRNPEWKLALMEVGRYRAMWRQPAARSESLNVSVTKLLELAEVLCAKSDWMSS